ncbi:MAG: DUF4097 domain-containing protein, partial [Limisphaerales bacterium]
SVEEERKVCRGSAANAADLLEQHVVELVEEKGVLKLTSDFPDGIRSGFFGPNVDVAIRVRVPTRFHLDAKTAGGSVEVEGLTGDVSARTAGGSLKLHNLTGDVVGKTSGGSIRGSGLKGRVDVTTSGGSIDLNEVSGGPVKAITAGGSMKLSAIAAPLDAHTSGGSIRVESLGESVVASTSGGSVDATFRRAPSGDVELRSSAGGVSVTLPGDAAFQLDAATSAGGVRSEFPVSTVAKTGDHGDRGRLKGSVNGGGAMIKLRTSAGGVHIRKS